MILIVFFVFPKISFAQVVINEVSSASEPEWVEVYNTSSTEVSLQSYLINFGSETQNKIFCDQDKIAPNGYKLIVLTTNWLSNTGDLVTLKKGDDIVDSIGYGTGYVLGKPASTGSITRTPDGGSEWVVTTLSTQQGEQVSFVCPTPTPTASPTQEPTNPPTTSSTTTPSPTPVAILKPSSTSTPTKTGTPKPTPIPTQAESVDETDRLPIPINLEDNTITTGEVLGDEITKKSPIIAILFIASGLAFLGYGGFLLYNKNNQNKVSQERKNY